MKRLSWLEICIYIILLINILLIPWLHSVSINWDTWIWAFVGILDVVLLFNSILAMTWFSVSIKCSVVLILHLIVLSWLLRNVWLILTEYLISWFGVFIPFFSLDVNICSIVEGVPNTVFFYIFLRQFIKFISGDW